MADEVAPTTQRPEIIFDKVRMGAMMRSARVEAGYSLRQLEQVSGVSDSEISKVESGSQDCRLESFVRVSAALGLPAGHLIDSVVTGDLLYFYPLVVQSAAFKQLPKKPVGAEHILGYNLASCASFYAHLIRCSRPERLAQLVVYPSKSLHQLFLASAASLETWPRHKRISTIKALRENPMSALSGIGVLDIDFAGDVILALMNESWSKPDWWEPVLKWCKLPKDFPVWLPFVQIQLFMDDNGLTDSEMSSSVAEVKTQLPSLLERLKRATAETGKKSELAEFLARVTGANVPLASVSRWLSGEREPGGEVALLLLKWVELQEGKAK
jgi:transcriptional regulator with XRE-family HTH domain